MTPTSSALSPPPADAAVIALDKTIEQLDVLADAGVVDAGGRGLLVLLDALCTNRVRSRADPPRVCAPAAGCRDDRRSTRSAAFRGDVPAERLRRPTGSSTLRQRLDELGDSVAIAASSSDGAGRYSVHVHCR